MARMNDTSPIAILATAGQFDWGVDYPHCALAARVDLAPGQRVTIFIVAPAGTDVDMRELLRRIDQAGQAYLLVRPHSAGEQSITFELVLQSIEDSVSVADLALVGMQPMQLELSLTAPA